ncbi:hypothetical protein Hypma_013450 [Hypsizygus marmoreus]|uniref:Uncharacterized protein n=1 Tax=Hypsizygus marmoreus TaxID=39966 RepID=A0A369JDH0_HYPMA|nr:hypothetical protein Hypma_013450 [Hypsizygus marmoreus]
MSLPQLPSLDERAKAYTTLITVEYHPDSPQAAVPIQAYLTRMYYHCAEISDQLRPYAAHNPAEFTEIHAKIQRWTIDPEDPMLPRPPDNTFINVKDYFERADNLRASHSTDAPYDMIVRWASDTSVLEFVMGNITAVRTGDGATAASVLGIFPAADRAAVILLTGQSSHQIDAMVPAGPTVMVPHRRDTLDLELGDELVYRPKGQQHTLRVTIEDQGYSQRDGDWYLIGETDGRGTTVERRITIEEMEEMVQLRVRSESKN